VSEAYVDEGRVEVRNGVVVSGRSKQGVSKFKGLVGNYAATGFFAASNMKVAHLILAGR